MLWPIRVTSSHSASGVTIRHDAMGQEAYETGILLALRAAATTTGVLVGLDKLVDLGISEPDGEPPRPTVREV